MVEKCECLECIKADAYEQQINNRRGIIADNLEDNLEGKPDDFLGGKLFARQNVIIYDRPNGNIIEMKKAGDEIGTIYSYVLRDGSVWWNIDGKNYSGFVLHQKGIFDDIALQNSLRENAAKKEELIKSAAEKRISENDNPLYNFLPDLGGHVKAIIIGVIVLVVGSLLLKLFK